MSFLSSAIARWLTRSIVVTICGGVGGGPSGLVASLALRGTEHLAAAQQLIDFLVSPAFQQQVALNLFVFPVHPEVELDQTFVDYAAIPDSPVSLDPAVIDAHREEWIDEWARLVQGT